jgi:SRSO17 transposase
VNTSIRKLVATAQGRWRIERDYQELKSELGLHHYEGRNWRGFHHHASLCIAAYGFLMCERLTGLKKKPWAIQNAYRTRRLPAARS